MHKITLNSTKFFNEISTRIVFYFNLYLDLVTKWTCNTCKRYAIEVFTVFALVNRDDIKHDHERKKKTDGDNETDDDPDLLSALVHDVERHVRKQSEREEKSEDKTDDVSVVIDPWKKADDEEEDHERREFSDCREGIFQHLPALNYFDEKAGKNAKLRSSRTSLISICKMFKYQEEKYRLKN